MSVMTHFISRLQIPRTVLSNPILVGCKIANWLESSKIMTNVYSIENSSETFAKLVELVWNNRSNYTSLELEKSTIVPAMGEQPESVNIVVVGKHTINKKSALSDFLTATRMKAIESNDLRVILLATELSVENGKVSLVATRTNIVVQSNVSSVTDSQQAVIKVRFTDKGLLHDSQHSVKNGRLTVTKEKTFNFDALSFLSVEGILALPKNINFDSVTNYRNLKDSNLIFKGLPVRTQIQVLNGILNPILRKAGLPVVDLDNEGKLPVQGE